MASVCPGEVGRGVCVDEESEKVGKDEIWSVVFIKGRFMNREEGLLHHRQQ